MEQDSSEVEPRGEIPSESEFARLLCDKTFVDYFNVFLSLPVFSQRLLFKCSDQSFELDPPLKRNQYRVDRIKLMRWVRTKRAPFFFKSDLYLEYVLCKQLQKSQLHLVFNYGPDATSAKEKIMDHCLMTRWLKRASGMRRFRCFISKTVGENAVQFWLDTEKFRRAAKQGEEQWALFYRKVETKYFKSRNVKLPPAAQMSPLQLYQSSLSSSTDTETTDGSTLQTMTRDTCLAIQGFILKSLQNYWVPRYFIHCKQRFTKYSQITTFKVYRPNCYAIRVRSLSEITAEGEGEEKEETASDVRSHHGIRKLQLLRQSVGNLMSMFSSNQVRRSQLSTLLKVEDTGEMVGAGSSESTDLREESGEMKSKGYDWLTDEFPLPAISEESASYERSRSASPVKGTPSITESVFDLSSTSTDGRSESDQGDEEESTLLFSGKTSKMSKHSSRRSSACCSAPSRRSAMADDDLDVQRPASARRLTSGRRSRRGSARRGSSKSGSSSIGSLKKDHDKHGTSDEEEASSSSSDESDQGHTKSPKPPIPATRTISTEESETDETDVNYVTDTTKKKKSEEMATDKDVHNPDQDRHKTDQYEVKHRGTIADLNKYRKNSDSSRSSSRDSSSTSVGHASVSSGSMISLSKRRILATSTGIVPRAPAMPKHPGARRPRSQSVEFRLGDFSVFIDKEENDSTKKKSSKSGSDKDIKLEADLVALKVLQKEREKKKRELLKKQKALKRNKARKKQAHSSDSTVPDLGTLQGGDDELFSTLKNLAMRRSRRVAPLSNINKTALKKLERLHSISLGEKDGHEKFNDSVENGMMTSRQGKRVAYSLLPFEDKLSEDDRRLMLVCDLPEALEVMEEGMDMMVPRRTQMLPAIQTPRPYALSITKPLLSGYNLGEADFRSKNRLLVSAILSDKFAGWPWMKFLVRYGYSKEQRYLRFWHAAQEYLDAAHPIAEIRQDLMRQKLAGELITNFLQPADDRKVRIGRLLTAELRTQLGASNGDELLLHAQDLACEALREVWADFQKHDLDSFISRTSERKNAQQRAYPLYTSPTLNLMNNRMVKPTPSDLPGKAAPKTLSQVLADARKTSTKTSIECATSSAKAQECGDQTNSVAPYRMIRAVKISSGLPLTGLPDAEFSDPSDPDEESDDEGSLRRKNMIVLRKRKIKSPPPRERKRPGGKDTQQLQTGTHSRAMRSREGYESQSTLERDQEMTKGGVCRAIRKGGKTIFRPSRPRSFMEVLHDQSHFEFFRRYLQVEMDNELPLAFWQSVEQLRTGTCRDPKVRQAKVQAIIKKYFNKSTNYGADLVTEADIITDLPNMEKVTPQMLMSAQVCVAKSMEEKWYTDYKESYPDESTDDASEAPAQAQFGQEGRTKYLWNMFISNVCQFRRGLMTPWLLSLFKEYLGKEVHREVEKHRVTGIITKRIIGGRVVCVDRLQNDLCFWAEVERYKQLADNAARAAAAGTYTIEDEEYVQKKANAIIDVFLASFVPPKVQINIPQDTAEEIIDNSQHGIVERGLFHDAALHTFTVLLYCWKKFTRERLAYKSSPMIEETTIPAPRPQPKITKHLVPGEFGPPSGPPPLKKKPKIKRKTSTPKVCGVKVKTIIGNSTDDAPRMFYTIENGVQLILPPKPQPEHESKELYLTLMQSLIDSGHEESLIQLFQQPAALGLGPAQQRRLSRTLAIQLPALLKQNAH